MSTPNLPSSSTAGVFFAYPGAPPITAEAMRETAKGMNARGISATVWEELAIEGRLMIDQVLSAIDANSTTIAEVGSMNSNVLFELGYAIARDKHAWAVLDETDTKATQNWRDFGLLSMVGRIDYGGSSQTLLHRFSQARPDLGGPDTLWSDLYAKIRSAREPSSLLHFSTASRDDSARSVTNSLARRKSLKVIRADQDERGAAPLEWFVDQIHRSTAVLIHLMGPDKERATTHNARAAFLAGLAHSLERPLLMIAPSDFTVPLDFKDLLFHYDTIRSLETRLTNWLDEIPGGSIPARPPGKTKLDIEIPLTFGEYVAEDERGSLPDYFVNTAEYQRVLSSGTAIFVGRKGTGKTATMLTATDQLRSDKRNLVVPIKPSGYELEALVGVLAQLPDRATADYFLEGLWKYLLFTEVACAAVVEAQSRAAGIPTGSKLSALADLLVAQRILVEEDFALRLERVVSEVATSIDEMPAGLKEQRGLLNQKLHSAALHDLRIAIGEALADRERVAILIDNLDKAWERGADYERLSRMIFGLLTAVGKVSADFGRDDAKKKRVNLSLAVFLRADIFSVVRQYAREPDKINTLQVHWNDPALLARVIEDRYVAAKNGEANPKDVWELFFCDQVAGMAAEDYLLWRCLARPRDLIYICNAAVLHAVNARRSTVQAEDVVAAEKEYSLFAFEALLVESDPLHGLSDLLFEFAGLTATLGDAELRSRLLPHVDNVDATLNALLRASFIGVETRPDRFDYPVDETSERLAFSLARKLCEKTGQEPRYRVHPAYRPYLEIVDDDLLSNLGGQSS